MKSLPNMALGSDWGRFLYFTGNSGENFNWHKEVKPTINIEGGKWRNKMTNKYLVIRRR